MAENNGAPRPLENRVDDLETSIRNLRELVGELYVDVKEMHASAIADRQAAAESREAIVELRRSSEAQRDSIKLLAAYADRLLKTAAQHEDRITGLESQS